jgi:hypothetical protein
VLEGKDERVLEGKDERVKERIDERVKEGMGGWPNALNIVNS